MSGLLFSFLCCQQPLSAQIPYIPGTGWQQFSWVNPSSGNNHQQNTEGAFTFTVYAGQGATLSVTDVGWQYELINVYDYGVYAGFTTSPQTGGSSWTSSFDAAFASPGWGSGTWPLAPGDYQLTFRLSVWNQTFPDINPNTLIAGFKVDIIQSPDSDGDGIADQFETETGIYVSPVDTGTNPNLADTDSDSLTDWDEITIHSTNPNLADSDLDGFNDKAEIEAGKDPLDDMDFPDAVVNIYHSVEFEFFSQTGENYQVQWSINLVDWFTFPEVIPGTGDAIIRFYSTRAEPKRYFRAEKTSP